MNNILQLKGQFQKRENTGGGGPINLPKGKMVSAAHLRELIQQLKSVYRYWENRSRLLSQDRADPWRWPPAERSTRHRTSIVRSLPC